MKKLILLSVSTLAATAFTTVVASPDAMATTSQPLGSSCSVTGYVGGPPTVTLASKAVVTHEKGLSLSPGASSTDSKTLTNVKQITASYKSSTTVGASTGLIEKIVGSVNAKTGLDVAHQSQTTGTTSETTSLTVRNNTSSQHKYVVFDGTTEFTGTWYTTTCNLTPGSTGTIGKVVKDQYGTLVTYATSEYGDVQCGITVSYAIDKAAQHYC